MYKHWMFALTIAALVGCSTKDLYEVGQSYQQSKCFKEAKTSLEYDACRHEERQSYDDYEKERKAVSQ